MSEEFEKNPIPADKPLVAKTRKKRTYTKKITTPRNEVALSAPPVTNKQEIDDCLSAIYQDDGGKLPNMQEIAIKKRRPVVKFMLIALSAGVALSLSAWLGLFYRNNKSTPTPEHVMLAVDGPEQLTLGTTSTYTITFRNKSDVTLNNITLNVNYPTGFLFTTSSLRASNLGHTEWRIKTLAPKQEGALSITGQNYGALQEAQSWRVFLNYQPANFNSELQKIATLTTAITDSPLKLSVSGPDKVYSGRTVEYTFEIKNNGAWSPNAFEIVPHFPDHFTIASSTPALNKEDRWTITGAANVKNTTSTKALPQKSWIFKVRGQFNEVPESQTTIGAIALLSLPTGNKTYEIARAELTPTIKKSELSFNIAINGSLDTAESKPGDLLHITARLKNNGSTPLKNITTKLTLDAPSVNRQSILEWSAINDQYDGTIRGEQLSDTVRRGEITWKSANIPALAALNPNDEVTIDIRLPVRSSETFDLAEIKDFLITANASAEYDDGVGNNITVLANPTTLTLNSDLNFEQRTTVTENKKTYTVSWILTNSLHALKNIEVNATVYGDSAWALNDLPGAGELTYNTKDKTINWKIPALPESIDVVNSNFTLTLNTVNPTQSELLSKIKITAEDAVTGKTISLVGDGISLSK